MGGRLSVVDRENRDFELICPLASVGLHCLTGEGNEAPSVQMNQDSLQILFFGHINAGKASAGLEFAIVFSEL